MAALSNSRTARIAVVLAFVLAMTYRGSAQTAVLPDTSATLSAPPHLTAVQDRRRLLGLLGLSELDLRPAPAGDARSPHATNYDEAKANVYPKLPDPLVFKSGRPVKTQADWSMRKREIWEDFDREVLGRSPVSMPEVEWHVLSTVHEKYGGVDVITKRLAGRVGPWMKTPIEFNIDLLLTVPANATGPVPVMMELAFEKDFQLATIGPLDSYVPTPWGVDGKLVVQQGWGFAILNPVSYQKDDGSGLAEGIIGLSNLGQPRKLDDWGVLKAWAWGAGQALTYFEGDKAVDAKQVGLAGHSRFGKAALVAMAYDPRFVIGYISSSGEGGAKLYRHIYGEQIPNVASASLYHWFDGNFLRHAGKLNAGDLPVDNHELIALCAPRPLFIGSGADTGDGYANPHGDAWADPRGMFLAEVAAGPVYRLLGANDLGTTQFPQVGTPLVAGQLAFRQHDGGHTPQPNWPYFLKFASRYLHAPGAAAAAH
ncbi:acetylxylan esterase [Telmatobacter sp. DSM 110680]|uniref:Acetylxylan esterase n=1 Tax=Telmatobacter sp. DSM 110680 TaxID=3036704 RepID=A0AAU7DRC4_9BACT